MILFKFHKALLATLVLVSNFHENNSLASARINLNLKQMWSWLKEKVVGGAEPMYTKPTVDDMVKTWKSFLALLGYAGTLTTDKLKEILSETSTGFSEARQRAPQDKQEEKQKSKGGCLPKTKGSCAKNGKKTDESEHNFQVNEESLKIIMKGLLLKEKEAFEKISKEEQSEDLAIEENQGLLKSLFYYCARKNNLVGDDRSSLFSYYNPLGQEPLSNAQKCTLACMLEETGMVDPGTGQAPQVRDQFNNVWLLLETTSSFVHELFPDYKDMAHNFFYKARALAEACLLVRVGEGIDKCEVANLYYQTVRGKDYSMQFMTVQNVWNAARSSFNAEIVRKKQEAQLKEEKAEEEKKKSKEREEEEANKNQ